MRDIKIWFGFILETLFHNFPQAGTTFILNIDGKRIIWLLVKQKKVRYLILLILDVQQSYKSHCSVDSSFWRLGWTSIKISTFKYPKHLEVCLYRDYYTGAFYYWQNVIILGYQHHTKLLTGVNKQSKNKKSISMCIFILKLLCCAVTKDAATWLEESKDNWVWEL
jgi:hypothetical protein